jgi:hypothetical protein
MSGKMTPILQASNAGEIETAFDSLAQTRPDALLVGPGPFLDSHREQTPGETIGNGRASAILCAREGAKVMVVDYRLDSAEDTCQMIAKEGGEPIAFQADATKSDDCQKVADGAMRNDDQVAGLQQLQPAHYCRPTVWRNNND